MSEASDNRSKRLDPRDHLERLQPIVEDLGIASIDDVGMYDCILRAALVKSFEFARLTNSQEPPSHSFFLTATLRGICEDLIVLKFLCGLSVQDRNDALGMLMRSNLHEGIESQADFFASERPWQPVLEPKREGEDFKNQDLRTLAKKLGWSGKQPWPTVWYMAKSESLEALYQYLYSATSKWVHFSPQVLLRMGWGGNKDDLGTHTKWKFTTSHFVQYYIEFNRVYSVLLLSKMMRGPAAEILPAEASEEIDGLDHCLDAILRWPEAVTFEELNLQGPSSFMRVMMRAAEDIEKDEDS